MPSWVSCFGSLETGNEELSALLFTKERDGSVRRLCSLVCFFFFSIPAAHTPFFGGFKNF